MKNLITTLALLAVAISCSKEKKETTKVYNDKLLVVKNNDVNELIRKYNDYENRYIKAFTADDLGVLKVLSDSSNYYDQLIFSEPITKKMTAEEKVKFNEQINAIRGKKIESLKKEIEKRDSLNQTKK